MPPFTAKGSAPSSPSQVAYRIVLKSDGGERLGRRQHPTHRRVRHLGDSFMTVDALVADKARATALYPIDPENPSPTRMALPTSQAAAAKRARACRRGTLRRGYGLGRRWHA